MAAHVGDEPSALDPESVEDPRWHFIAAPSNPLTACNLRVEAPSARSDSTFRRLCTNDVVSVDCIACLAALKTPRYAHADCDRAILEDRPEDACPGCQHVRDALITHASEDPQTAFAPKSGGDGDMMPVDLREDGILWLVNAAVFHPRGFALGVRRFPDGTTRFGILGDGSEPWQYKPDDPDVNERMAAVERMFARARERNT